MSTVGDAFAALRRLMLMDSEIERMKSAVSAADTRLDNHAQRLMRIETLIEFGRPRLPRGGPPAL